MFCVNREIAITKASTSRYGSNKGESDWRKGKEL